MKIAEKVFRELLIIKKSFMKSKVSQKVKTYRSYWAKQAKEEQGDQQEYESLIEHRSVIWSAIYC